MAAAQVSIIRKTDFSLQVSATASAVTDAVLAPLVDTVGWVSAVSLLRLYSASAYPASATLKLIVQNVMTGPDDPNTILVASGTGTAEITIAASTSNLLQLVQFTTPISRYVKVLLRATSGGTAGTITTTVAVDLVGRDA